MPDPVSKFDRESRVVLSGGLNTRGTPFRVRPDQFIQLNNFRTNRDGALELRDGASLLFTNNYPVSVAGSLAANSRSPAPTLTLVAGGSMPFPQTFTCKLVFPGWEGKYGATLVAAGVLTAVGTRSIRVSVKPNNLGEGVGQAAPAIDDPLMQGVSDRNIDTYLESTGTPGTFYLQPSGTYVWSTTNLAWERTFTAFNVGGTVFSTDTVNPQPIREIYRHKAADMAVMIAPDRAFQFPTFQTVTGANEWLNPTDKDGNLYYLNRSPSDLSISESLRVMVLMDGFRPKKSTIGDGSSTPYLTPQALNAFVMLGANPPDAVPTVTETAGAVFAAGEIYTYRQTFIYRHSRVVDRNRTEFWYSESRPTQSLSHTVVAANTNLTVTANAAEAETNLYLVRFYRTLDHQSTPTSPGRFFWLADVAVGAGLFADGIADATLVTRTKVDPDDEGRTPLDVPPNNLVHSLEHKERVWGIIGRVVNVSSADLRVRGVVGGNIARVSRKQQASYLDPAVAGNEQTTSVEFSVDAWPDDANHTLQLGGEGSVSDWLSHRGQILVFKTDEIGVVSGELPGQFSYDELYTDIGAVPRSVLNVQGVIYFWNAEKGPYVFDGRTYSPIGFDILLTWQIDSAANFYCWQVIHDRATEEIRWSFTDATVDPDTSAATEATARGSWKEYVYHPSDSSWWIFTGTGAAREVRAVANLQSQNLTNPLVGSLQTTFGDTSGRVMIDHQANKDVTVIINATATFRIFGFGADFDWVKVFKFLQVLYRMGAPGEGSVIFSAKVAQGSNFGNVLTLNAATVGDQTNIADLPSPIDSTDGVTQDRGLEIKVTSTIDTTFLLEAVQLYYERVDQLRKTI